jgi:hypothetical protein
MPANPPVVPPPPARDEAARMLKKPELRPVPKKL